MAARPPPAAAAAPTGRRREGSPWRRRRRRRRAPSPLPLLVLALLALLAAPPLFASASTSATAAAASAALASMAAKEGAASGPDRLPQGLSGRLPGWTPQERLLLARLLGQPPHPEAGGPGSAAAAAAAAASAAAASADDADTDNPPQIPGRAYWDSLDEAARRSTPVKQMFETAWYRCQKLNSRLSDLIDPSLAGPLALNPGALFDAEAVPQMLAWLGIDDSLLPPPGAKQQATYRDLERVLEAVGKAAAAKKQGGAGAGIGGIGASNSSATPPTVARLVPDPVPFLRSAAPASLPVDRNGVPMLVHVTLKDKNALQRHQLLSLASWAVQNPGYSLLLYDDSDLRAYILSDDDWFSRIGAPQSQEKEEEEKEETEEERRAGALAGGRRRRGLSEGEGAGGEKKRKKKKAASAAEVYARLRTPVERADLWRYMVMCRHGGIYADSDTLCVRPAQEWNRENEHDAEVLLGVEDVFRRDPLSPPSGWGVRRGRWGVQFEQWALAAAARQPVFCGMLDLIRARLDDEAAGGGGGGGRGGGGSSSSSASSSLLSGVGEAAAAFGVGGGSVGRSGNGGKAGKGAEHAQDWGVLHRTGPHVWTDSVLRWMNLRGVGFHEALLPGGALVRDRQQGASGGGGGDGAGGVGAGGGSSALSARVMPPEAFGCAAHFFAADTNLEDVHVMHMFRGVWRARASDDEDEGGGGGAAVAAAASAGVGGVGG